MRERRLAHRRVARRRDWSATRSMLPPVLRGLVPLAMLWPAVLDPTAAKETVHDRSSSSSFDWGALSRLRALPASAHVDEQDCEALAAALPVPMPLVAPPSQEITQGYLPERLQLGQHISGFKLTSFVRRIPLLAPQLPAASSSMATPTSVQVHPGVNADAVALSRRFALPGQADNDADEVFALPAPSTTLAVFDPRAAESAVSESLLALPPAAHAPTGGTVAATVIGKQVALARVRPASLSEEEKLHSDRMLAVLSAGDVPRPPQTPGSLPDDNGAGGGVPGYSMGRRIGHGHHGEVWRAERVRPSRKFASGRRGEDSRKENSEPTERYVLKRIFVEKGIEIRLSGLREVYFGEMLKGRELRSVARYIEWFERIDVSQVSLSPCLVLS